MDGIRRFSNPNFLTYFHFSTRMHLSFFLKGFYGNNLKINSQMTFISMGINTFMNILIKMEISDKIEETSNFGSIELL